MNFSTSFNVNELRKELDVNQAPFKFGSTPDISTQTIRTDTIVRTTAVQRYNYQDYIFRTGIGTDNIYPLPEARTKRDIMRLPAISTIRYRKEYRF